MSDALACGHKVRQIDVLWPPRFCGFLIVRHEGFSPRDFTSRCDPSTRSLSARQLTASKISLPSLRDRHSLTRIVLGHLDGALFRHFRRRLHILYACRWSVPCLVRSPELWSSPAAHFVACRTKAAERSGSIAFALATPASMALTAVCNVPLQHVLFVPRLAAGRVETSERLFNDPRIWREKGCALLTLPEVALRSVANGAFSRTECAP